MFDDKEVRCRERLEMLKEEVVIQDLAHRMAWEGERRGGKAGRDGKEDGGGKDARSIRAAVCAALRGVSVPSGALMVSSGSPTRWGAAWM